MKRNIIAFLLLILSYTVPAQIIIMQDPVSARTFNGDKYSGMKGSPFLFDKWIAGSVTTPKGIYQNLEIKLDAYSNILYHSKDDLAYEIQDPVISFRLFSGDTLSYKKGLTGKNLAADQFVQVLAEGKISFYRSDIKLISEMSEINVGVIKTFITATRYYLARDGQINLVRLTKSEVLEFTRDQEEKVRAFIDENKLPAKKETDFIKILQFYNSL